MFSNSSAAKAKYCRIVDADVIKTKLSDSP